MALPRRERSAARTRESSQMDLYATVPSPVEAVFGHLADPSRLGDWLPDVSAADPELSGGIGADFPLTVHVDGIEVAASGEETAFEPPWLVGYRLFIGSRDARDDASPAPQTPAGRGSTSTRPMTAPRSWSTWPGSPALSARRPDSRAGEPDQRPADKEDHGYPNGTKPPVRRLPAGRRRHADPAVGHPLHVRPLLSEGSDLVTDSGTDPGRWARPSAITCGRCRPRAGSSWRCWRC